MASSDFKIKVVKQPVKKDARERLREQVDNGSIFDNLERIAHYTRQSNASAAGNQNNLLDAISLALVNINKRLEKAGI